MKRSNRITRTIVADTNLLFRRGLAALLASQEDFNVAAEASTVEEVIGQIESMPAATLVLDLSVLQNASPEQLFRLRQHQRSCRMLVLTVHDGPEQLALAVNAGARGYILKNSTSSQLLYAVRLLISLPDEHPNRISEMLPDLNSLSASGPRSRRDSSLTAREQEVARLLAEGRTVRETAFELSLSIKTIEAHKLNLMRKLDIHDRTSLVRYATESNLVGAPVAQ